MSSLDIARAIIAEMPLGGGARMLSPGALALCVYLDDETMPSIVQAAEELGAGQATVQKWLDEVETAGLVERWEHMPHAAKNAVSLVLTPKGKRMRQRRRGNG